MSALIKARKKTKSTAMRTFSRIFVFLKMFFIKCSLSQSLGTHTIIQDRGASTGGVSVQIV
jgi:hypothetical protein